MSIMRHHWLRPLWIVLALLFLLEAWLWDHLQPIVDRLVSFVSWGRLKVKLRRLIEMLPPWAVLFVFIVPFLVMLPLKFVEVYFLATGNWFGAISVIIFDVTRRKLLEMAWFRRVYEWFMRARVWAHSITEPVRARVRQLIWLMKPGRIGRFLRHFLRVRRKAYRNRAA